MRGVDLAWLACCGAGGCLALPDTPFDNPCDPANGGCAAAPRCSGTEDEHGVCWVPVVGGVYRLGLGEVDAGDPWAPSHQVELSPFRFMAWEASNAQVAGAVAAERPRPDGTPEDYASAGIWAHHPAAGVSHEEATAWCAGIDGRLPTEAEWEAAAGGRVGRPPRIYPWGGGLADCEHVRFAGCGEGPVAPDGLADGCTESGVCHLAGNVAEWVSDGFDAGYYGDLAALDPPAKDPTGPAAGGERQARGGSFASDASAVTTYHRQAAGEARSAAIGFRCVLPGGGS